MSWKHLTRESRCLSRRRFARAQRQQNCRRYGTVRTESRIEDTELYDLVIVGGGPVGLALLTAIKSEASTRHLKCALIETQSLLRQKSWDLPISQFSNRASSITPTNQSFLEICGAWKCLDHTRVQSYDAMQVWDGANSSSIGFNWSAEAAKYNAPLRTVASMTENANLSRALLRRIDELDAQDSLLDTSSVEQIEYGSNHKDGLNLASWPILTVTSSANPARTRKIAARLLVGADGMNSPVRTFAGINTNGWDYGRHGVVATLQIRPSSQIGSTSPPASNFDQGLETFLESEEDRASQGEIYDDRQPSNRATAYQRFLPALGGPIAILPLPRNHASLVWSTTPKIASYLKSLSPDAFVATVNAALRLSQTDINYMLSLPSDEDTKKPQHQEELDWRLTHTDYPPIDDVVPIVDAVQPGTIASFPLRLRNATSYSTQRIALAGDAAHTIHPLAGQGLNLGLGDAAALAASIKSATECGRDIGDLMSLERYSKERYYKAVQMSSGVDLLNSIYQLGASGGFLGNAMGRMRGLGMWTINQVPGLKELIMKQAE